MRKLQLLTYIILDISLIFISGSNVVEGQFFNFGSRNKKIQKKKEGLRTASIATNMVVKSQSLSFLLFTRKNRVLPEFLTAENAPLSEYFSRDKETKIILHSFMQGATDKIYLQIKDAYLNAKDLNVILVDWPHARVYTYSISASVTEHVGVETVRLIKALNPPLDKVHIVGFGLGAHSGGIAGAEFFSEIGRITGLDPSMPLFRMLDDYFKLDENDAKFVDIIHTDAGDNFWFANHLGLGKPSGSVDFYPNKGIFQPGCLNTSILNYEDMYCSHIRSLELFAESIENPNSLMACKCNNWASFMSAKCDCTNEENLIAVGEGSGTDVKEITGRYYLITNERKPFGMGKTGSRSPRENTMQDIKDSLDKLAKIVTNKESDRESKNLRSFVEKLFTKEEIDTLNTLKLFDNHTKQENEHIRPTEEQEENEQIVPIDEHEENDDDMFVNLEEQDLEIYTTPIPVPLNLTGNSELESDTENQSEYEDPGDKSEHRHEVSPDPNKSVNAPLKDDVVVVDTDEDSPYEKRISNSTNANFQLEREKDERTNKLHLLYVIGTLKSGDNIDGLKEYRILK